MSTQAVVVAAEGMDDETFCAHLNKRHLNDLGLSGIEHHEPTAPSYYASLRAFHDRVHDIAVPGQHDHAHE